MMRVVVHLYAVWWCSLLRGGRPPPAAHSAQPRPLFQLLLAATNTDMMHCHALDCAAHCFQYTSLFSHHSWRLILPNNTLRPRDLQCEFEIDFFLWDVPLGVCLVQGSGVLWVCGPGVRGYGCLTISLGPMDPIIPSILWRNMYSRLYFIVFSVHLCSAARCMTGTGCIGSRLCLPWVHSASVC